MTATNREIIIRYALLAALGLSMAAAAPDALAREQAAGTGAIGATVWPAPVGHRQPRAADIPAATTKHASDAEQERRDRALDRRLRICRGC
jgi:hypothetical protein